jgi:hypothetical protein
VEDITDDGTPKLVDENDASFAAQNGWPGIPAWPTPSFKSSTGTPP